MKNTKMTKVINLFEKVQKIPYFLFKHRDSRKLFILNKGCCAEKTIWLGNRFRERRIPVKYYLLKFRWEDLPIPQKILKLKKRGVGYHLSLKAKINNRWIWVDPTWDLPLAKIGLPITQNWNGKSNTKLAVTPLEITDFKPEDPSDTDLDRKFIQALNKYFGTIRQLEHRGIKNYGKRN